MVGFSTSPIPPIRTTSPRVAVGIFSNPEPMGLQARRERQALRGQLAPRALRVLSGRPVRREQRVLAELALRVQPGPRDSTGLTVHGGQQGFRVRLDRQDHRALMDWMAPRAPPDPPVLRARPEQQERRARVRLAQQALPVLERRAQQAPKAWMVLKDHGVSQVLQGRRELLGLLALLALRARRGLRALLAPRVLPVLRARPAHRAWTDSKVHRGLPARREHREPLAQPARKARLGIPAQPGYKE